MEIVRQCVTSTDICNGLSHARARSTRHIFGMLALHAGEMLSAGCSYDRFLFYVCVSNSPAEWAHSIQQQYSTQLILFSAPVSEWYAHCAEGTFACTAQHMCSLRTKNPKQTHAHTICSMLSLPVLLYERWTIPAIVFFFFQHKSCVYARGIRIWMGCIVWPAALRYTIMRMRIRVRMHPRPQLIFNTGKLYVWLEPTSFSSSPSWFCVLLRANSSMRDWCPCTRHYQMNSQMVIRCQNGNYSYQHSLHQLDGFVWFMLIVH